MKTNKNRILLLIAISFFLSLGSKAQGLYVGTNYHPHDDKNIEKIKKRSEVPLCVMSHQIDKNHYLYLNDGNFKIAPYKPEFIEIK